MGGNRPLDLGGLAAMLVALAAACTSPTPAQATPSAHAGTSTTGNAAASAKASAVLKREGLAVPSTYRQACAAEARGFTCSHVPAGPIPAALQRPLRFPVLRAGQRCPASRGTLFNSPYFRGIALGTEPVRVILADVGDVRHGIAKLFNPSNSPPWLALKTLWFSLPAYQGPFVIRARRLGRPGPVWLEGGRATAWLVMPPGPTLDSAGYSGYRTIPGGLLVKTPGCYAWQVDGLGFSEIMVVRAVLR